MSTFSRQQKIILLATFVQVLVLAAIVYAAEGWLRWRYQEVRSSVIHYPLGPDIAGETLLFEQLEYSITLRYNRLGFRGPEFPDSKPAPGVSRIVYLGDSFVEGMGVSETERFSDLVEAKLSAAGVQVSTVNLGQAGTAPSHYLANLTNIGLAFQPEVVVFGLYMGNDFETIARQPITSKPVGQLLRDAGSAPGLAYLRLMARQIVSHESLLLPRNSAQGYWERMYRRPINREMIRERTGLPLSEMEAALAGIEPNLAEAAFAGRLNPNSLVDALTKNRPRRGRQGSYTDADFSAVASILLECQRLCFEKGVRLIVLLIPDFAQAAPESFLAAQRRWGFSEMPFRIQQLPDLRRRTSELLEEHHIPYLDLTASLSQLGGRGYYPLDRHITAAGHRCIAEQLLPVLALGARPRVDHP